MMPGGASGRDTLIVPKVFKVFHKAYKIHFGQPHNKLPSLYQIALCKADTLSIQEQEATQP